MDHKLAYETYRMQWDIFKRLLWLNLFLLKLLLMWAHFNC